MVYETLRMRKGSPFGKALTMNRHQIGRQVVVPRPGMAVMDRIDKTIGDRRERGVPEYSHARFRAETRGPWFRRDGSVADSAACAVRLPRLGSAL